MVGAHTEPWEISCAYRLLDGKPEQMRLFGRPWHDNITMGV